MIRTFVIALAATTVIAAPSMPMTAMSPKSPTDTGQGPKG